MTRGRAHGSRWLRHTPGLAVTEPRLEQAARGWSQRLGSAPAGSGPGLGLVGRAIGGICLFAFRCLRLPTCKWGCGNTGLVFLSLWSLLLVPHASPLYLSYFADGLFKTPRERDRPKSRGSIQRRIPAQRPLPNSRHRAHVPQCPCSSWGLPGPG